MMPFDVSYHFDADLREVANAPDEMQAMVDWLQTQLECSDRDQQTRLKYLGLLGTYARILHSFSVAEIALQQAIALAQSIGSDRHQLINQIRLAHVYQWQQHYATAQALFDSALMRCQTQPELVDFLDFVYQHLGKCKFDQAQYAEAIDLFEAALAIRLNKGERSLIESTQLALATAHRLT